MNRRKRAAVAHLEELRQRHRARLAEAVDDEAADADQQQDGDRDLLPEVQHEAGDQDDLELRHRVGQARVGLAAGVGQQVSAGAAAGGEEVGDALDEPPRVDGEREHQRDRDDDQDPVDQLHAKTCDLLRNHSAGRDCRFGLQIRQQNHASKGSKFAFFRQLSLAIAARVWIGRSNGYRAARMQIERLAIIGPRGHTHYVFTGLEKPMLRVRMVAVTADAEPVAKWCAEHGHQPQMYSDWSRDAGRRQAASGGGVRSVRAAPTMTIEALNRGIHVFTEKTAALTFEDLEKLRTAHPRIRRFISRA